MNNFVVIDASPLIGLAIVDGLSWLLKLFDTAPVVIKENLERAGE